MTSAYDHQMLWMLFEIQSLDNLLEESRVANVAITISEFVRFLSLTLTFPPRKLLPPLLVVIDVRWSTLESGFLFSTFPSCAASLTLPLFPLRHPSSPHVTPAPSSYIRRCRESGRKGGGGRPVLSADGRRRWAGERPVGHPINKPAAAPPHRCRCHGDRRPSAASVTSLAAGGRLFLLVGSRDPDRLERGGGGEAPRGEGVKSS